MPADVEESVLVGSGRDFGIGFRACFGKDLFICGRQRSLWRGLTGCDFGPVAKRGAGHVQLFAAFGDGDV